MFHSKNEALANLNSSLIGYINAQNKIASITTAGASWEATENCWVTGYIIATASGSRASIFVDGIPFAISMYSTSENVYVTIPVKKGQVVTTRDTGGYTLEVYGCL